MIETHANNQQFVSDEETPVANVRSRIFWRISACIFGSILLIELILLAYSWFTERDRILSRLDETLAVLATTLDIENPVPQLQRLVEENDADREYSISAFSFLSSNGELSVSGHNDALANSVSEANPVAFDQDAGTYSKLIVLDGSDGEQSKLWLQADATWINQYMRSYIARILGMVLLISVFVTLACLFFLRPILINPLLRLDRLLVRSQKQGIDSASASERDLRRSDELGSVFREFDLLRNQLVESESANAEKTKRFEELANLGADFFWEVDSKLVFTYVAGDSQKLFSLSLEDVRNRKFDDVISELAPRMPGSDSLLSSLLEKGEWEGKIFNKNSSDSKPLAVRIMGAVREDADGRIIGYRGTMKNVTKELELSDKLRFQATHDELTRLSNRRELSSQLQLALEGFVSDNRVFSLMVVDIDRFKSINDTAGHGAGDGLLKSLSSKLVQLVSENDTVARLGGDEFAILLQDTHLQRAQEIAEIIRGEIEVFQFVWKQQVFSISASIGVAEVSSSLSTEEAIMFAIDSCCLSAKRNGKNQVRVYSGEEQLEHVTTKDESLWISRIMHALDNDGFILYRQSIVPIDPASDEEHFETLVRMKNPDGGIWTPDKFLPVAERNALMPKIDQWVTNRSLEWLAAMDMDADSNFCMNINLSAASLADHNFCEYLSERVSTSTSINHFVCFEMTESAAMTNYEQTVEFLNHLKQHGCAIALDDFGTGFSSLSHIRKLPLDYIKIDGVFVQEIASNELDQVVVKSVADIAKVLNIRTVAEFVDTEEALQMLESLEIDYAQGFLFSKPEPINMPGQASIAQAA